MSVASLGVKSLEIALPKVISPRTHGYIDYGHAAFFLGVALCCRKSNPRAASVALGTSAFILVEALLTDYPLGVERVLPFALHGKLDSGFAAASLAAPRLFGFEETKAAVIFKTNAFVEAAVVGMTDFDSQRAHEEA